MPFHVCISHLEILFCEGSVQVFFPFRFCVFCAFVLDLYVFIESGYEAFVEFMYCKSCLLFCEFPFIFRMGSFDDGVFSFKYNTVCHFLFMVATLWVLCKEFLYTLGS